MYKTIALNTCSSFRTNKESGEEFLIDAEDLSKEMEAQTNKMVESGFELVTVTPVQSGNISNGTGYMHTSSIVLTFEKI